MAEPQLNLKDYITIHDFISRHADCFRVTEPGYAYHNDWRIQVRFWDKYGLESHPVTLHGSTFLAAVQDGIVRETEMELKFQQKDALRNDAEVIKGIARDARIARKSVESLEINRLIFETGR